jgi:hypothetical protein
MSKRSRKTSSFEQLDPVSAPNQTAGGPSVTPVNQVDVAELAYQRWVERGRPQGCPEDDWFEAERELRSRSAGPARRTRAHHL